ncbi:MAG: RCC1 domain-containing protein [Peptococcia bacterium]|jgi:hypothetical protein
MQKIKGFFKRISLLLILIFICVVILLTPHAEAATFEQAQEYGKRMSSGSYHALVIDSEGNVIAWGNDELYSVVPEGISNVVDVKGSRVSNAVITSDGTAYIWGRDFNSSFHTGSYRLPGIYRGRVIDVGFTYKHPYYGGYDAIYLLLSDGTIAGGEYKSTATGISFTGKANLPAENFGFKALECAGHRCVGLKTDGTVEVWGGPIQEESIHKAPKGLSDVIAISASDTHTLALKSDGTVVAWGSPAYPQGWRDMPKDLSDVVAISAGNNYSLALLSDGTVVAWGSEPYYLNVKPDAYSDLVIPEGLNNVVAISAGNPSFALRSDGTIVAWGDNSYWFWNFPDDLFLGPVEEPEQEPEQEEEPISNIQIKSTDETALTKCILNSSFISRVSFNLDEAVNSAELEFSLPSNVSITYVMNVKREGSSDVINVAIQDNKVIISQEGQELAPGKYEMQLLLYCTNMFKINTKSFSDTTEVINYSSTPLLIEAQEQIQS